MLGHLRNRHLEEMGGGGRGGGHRMGQNYLQFCIEWSRLLDVWIFVG